MRNQLTRNRQNQEKEEEKASQQNANGTCIAVSKRFVAIRILTGQYTYARHHIVSYRFSNNNLLSGEENGIVVWVRFVCITSVAKIANYMPINFHINVNIKNVSTPVHTNTHSSVRSFQL